MADEKKAAASPVNATAPKPPETPTQLPLSEISADELAAPLAANMPEPTPGASAPGSVEKAAESTPAPRIESGLKDNAGNIWNPERYKSIEGKPGTPRYDAKGYFIPINKGRPKGGGNPANPGAAPAAEKSVMPSGTQTAAPGAPESKASIPVAGNGETAPDKYDHAAELYFNMLCPMFCGIVSQEFLPGFSYDEKGEPFIDAKMRDMEKQSITVPLAAYMRAKQSEELSPKWALALASIGYIGRRVQMPETQKKTASWLVKAKSLFGMK